MGNHQSLAVSAIDTEYTIKAIMTDDAELENFLFTLGCYVGEKVTIISQLAGNYIITVKDARYSIDSELAAAIFV